METIESQIWLKAEEKRAQILLLRGDQVSRLTVTGMSLTLKKKAQGVVEALQQGQDLSAVGVKSVETLDARTIRKAEVSPGNGSLTLHGGEDGSKKLSFSAPSSNADEILRTILARSGRTFQPSQEDIGVGEALLPPGIIGVVAGLLWMGVYQSAVDMAAGKEVVAKGRRQGLQNLLIGVAQMLGTGGTIAVGAVILALVVAWAAKRIVHRPQRTVWVPEGA
jgi:hypothetical protein